MARFMKLVDRGFCSFVSFLNNVVCMARYRRTEPQKTNPKFPALDNARRTSENIRIGVLCPMVFVRQSGADRQFKHRPRSNTDAVDS